MKIKMELKEARSFGVIPVFRVADKSFGKSPLFCIVRAKDGHWGFPKGRCNIDQNESEQETALRELREETGIADCDISNNHFFIEEYFFESRGVRHHKLVKYFLGFVHSMEAQTPADFKEE